ncbi:site-specific integrase [Chromobacterium violaceum]|uniref:site-specific integrase n=1 Tax=Chromobacterium violaceum TaxID=536 RepID=UPI0035A58233
MHKLPRLLKSRHGVYYLRVCQGKDLRRSLGTKDFHQAKFAALLFNLQVEMNKTILTADNVRKLDVLLPNGIQINNVKPEEKSALFELLDKLGVTSEQLLSLNTQQVASLLAGPNPQKKAEQPKRKSKLLSEVIALYLSEKKLDNVAKTIEDKERTYNEFMSFFEDKDINAYDVEVAVSYKNRLVAANASATRINAKTSFLKDLFSYAIDNNLYFSSNPFERVRVSSKSKLKQQVESYRDFTDDELKLIFAEVPYRDFMNKLDYYWLPFLALYSGARVEELASLSLEQIKKDGEVHYFELEKAKNRNSVRKIPLHRKIEESGFLAYVEGLRQKGETMLFPHLTAGKNGYSKNMSRRFGLYLDTLKLKDSRKVFHSFRHTFITRLTDMGTNPAVVMALVGHYEQAKVDLSAPHFATYQHEKPLVVLKKAMDMLEFPIKHFW